MPELAERIYMAFVRYDVISDTHGYLSPELLDELQGADYIVHAGDMTSLEDYKRLQEIAPVRMCLGNNDFAYDYGPMVRKKVFFLESGLKWEICHYRERLDLTKCDIAVCGHTHRPFIEKDEWTHALVMNPGSPSFPRGGGGPTMGRVIVDDTAKKVVQAEIIQLNNQSGFGELASRLFGRH